MEPELNPTPRGKLGQDGYCSGLMKPDTHLGENARHIEVSDDQATSCLFR